jgi:hypothetical protein
LSMGYSFRMKSSADSHCYLWSDDNESHGDLIRNWFTFAMTTRTRFISTVQAVSVDALHYPSVGRDHQTSST